jgi:four helix bundle protein
VGKLESEKVKGEVDIDERTYAFALRIIKLVESLPRQRRISIVLGDQLLRAGTSIAANVEESRGAQSKADFTSKMNIAYKESRETVMWLRMIRDVHLLPADRMEDIIQEAKEIKAILGSSVKSARKKHHVGR